MTKSGLQKIVFKKKYIVALSLLFNGGHKKKPLSQYNSILIFDSQALTTILRWTTTISINYFEFFFSFKI